MFSPTCLTESLFSPAAVYFMSPSGGEKLPVRDRSNVGRGQCSSLDDPIAGRHDAMLILLGPTGWLIKKSGHVYPLVI